MKLLLIFAAALFSVQAVRVPYIIPTSSDEEYYVLLPTDSVHDFSGLGIGDKPVLQAVKVTVPRYAPPWFKEQLIQKFVESHERSLQEVKEQRLGGQGTIGQVTIGQGPVGQGLVGQGLVGQGPVGQELGSTQGLPVQGWGSQSQGPAVFSAQRLDIQSLGPQVLPTQGLNVQDIGPQRQSPQVLSTQESPTQTLPTQGLNVNDLVPQSQAPQVLGKQELSIKEPPVQELVPQSPSPQVLSTQELSIQDPPSQELVPQSPSPQVLSTQELSIQDPPSQGLVPQGPSPQVLSTQGLDLQEPTAQKLVPQSPSPQVLSTQKPSIQPPPSQGWVPKSPSPQVLITQGLDLQGPTAQELVPLSKVPEVSTTQELGIQGVPAHGSFPKAHGSHGLGLPGLGLPGQILQGLPIQGLLPQSQGAQLVSPQGLGIQGPLAQVLTTQLLQQGINVQNIGLGNAGAQTRTALDQGIGLPNAATQPLEQKIGATQEMVPQSQDPQVLSTQELAIQSIPKSHGSQGMGLLRLGLPGLQELGLPGLGLPGQGLLQGLPIQGLMPQSQGAQTVGPQGIGVQGPLAQVLATQLLSQGIKVQNIGVGNAGVQTRSPLDPWISYLLAQNLNNPLFNGGLLRNRREAKLIEEEEAEVSTTASYLDTTIEPDVIETTTTAVTESTDIEDATKASATDTTQINTVETTDKPQTEREREREPFIPLFGYGSLLHPEVSHAFFPPRFPHHHWRSSDHSAFNIESKKEIFQVTPVPPVPQTDIRPPKISEFPHWRTHLATDKPQTDSEREPFIPLFGHGSLLHPEVSHVSFAPRFPHHHWRSHDKSCFNIESKKEILKVTPVPPVPQTDIRPTKISEFPHWRTHLAYSVGVLKPPVESSTKSVLEQVSTTPKNCDIECTKLQFNPVCAFNGDCYHEFPNQCVMDTFVCKHPEVGFKATTRDQCQIHWVRRCNEEELKSV